MLNSNIFLIHIPINLKRLVNGLDEKRYWIQWFSPVLWMNTVLIRVKSEQVSSKKKPLREPRGTNKRRRQINHRLTRLTPINRSNLIKGAHGDKILRISWWRHGTCLEVCQKRKNFPLSLRQIRTRSSESEQAPSNSPCILTAFGAYSSWRLAILAMTIIGNLHITIRHWIYNLLLGLLSSGESKRQMETFAICLLFTGGLFEN